MGVGYPCDERRLKPGREQPHPRLCILAAWQIASDILTLGQAEPARLTMTRCVGGKKEEGSRAGGGGGGGLERMPDTKVQGCLHVNEGHGIQ